MITQIKTSACETTYDVNGIKVKLWVIVGGTPCLDFADYSPFKIRFPMIEKYSSDNWIDEENRYKHQNPNNMQGITYQELENGEQALYKFVGDSYLPKHELCKRRWDLLPIEPVPGGMGSKIIVSKRVRDKEERTYVRAELVFDNKFRIGSVCVSSPNYHGQLRNNSKLFHHWWTEMDDLLRSFKGKVFLSDLTYDEWFSIVKMIKRYPKK